MGLEQGRRGSEVTTFVVPGLLLSAVATSLNSMASWWLLGPIYLVSFALMGVGAVRAGRRNERARHRAPREQ